MLPEELKDLVSETARLMSEQQTIEVKSAHEGTPGKLYDTLSSFSNQDSGGVIIFGIDEKRGYRPVGVHDVDKLQNEIAERAKQMSPIVRPLFTVCMIDDHPIVSAEIPSIDLADRPCFYKGKGRVTGSYKRVGSFDEPMTEFEVYSYEAYRKHFQDDIRVLDRSDDEQIDPVALEKFLRRVRDGKPHLAQLADDQILSLMSLTHNAKLTLAGLFLLGYYPQSLMPQLCVTAIRVPGKEMGDVSYEGDRFLDNRRIEGPLPTMLADTMEFFRRNIRQKTRIDAEGNRSDEYEYPLIALREIVINALIHRDYSALTEGIPITVRIFDDRIEVSNPGGLYGRVNVSDLGKVKPDTRNPVIATSMEVLGLTENRYSGIPTIRREMANASLPAPEFRSTLSEFTVVLYGASSITIDTTTRRRLDDKNVSSTQLDIQSRILAFCQTPRTRAEIAEMLCIQTVPYVTRHYLTPMVKSGMLCLTLPEKPRSPYQRYKSNS